MAALLLLLAFLLIASSAGGAVATAKLGTDDASLPYYSSNSEVMTYWQRVLPNSAMPSAIVEHLYTCNERVTFQQGFRKEREDEKVTFGWGSNTEVHDEKVRWGTQMKGDDGRATFQCGQHSQDGEKATFGWGPSTNELNKEINFQQENQIKGDDGKVTFRWGPHIEEDGRKTTLGWGLTKNGPNKETNFQRKIQMEDDGRVTFHWGSIEKDDEKATVGWNLHHQGNDERISFGVGQQREHDDDHKVTFNWGYSHRKTDDEKTTLGWGSKTKSGDQEVTYQWSQNMDGGDMKKVIGPLGFHESELLNDNHKVTFNWGSSHNEGNDEKVTSGWGPKMENDGHKVTFNWDSSHNERNDEKGTSRWGPKTENDGHKVTCQRGPNMDGDIKKVVVPLGSHASELSNNDDHKITSNWSSSRKEGNDEKVTFGWDSKTENGRHKVTYQWGPNMDEASDTLGTHPNGGDDKITLTWRTNNQNIASLRDSSHQREEHHHQVHGTGHKHGQFNMANILFLEAVLTPGTLIAPYIEPSVSPTPFMRREIADSIPISTGNFTDILSMFAPMPHAMVGKVWSTLRTCEHPHPLEGEEQACATSIESMVELAASVLGTSDLQAFSSSPDVPVEGFAPSPASKYKVAAVRAITSPGEKATTMTCHGMTFPYAVFYCHAVNPTRVYEVTLQMGVEDDGAAETMMQVIAVCHLDTSQFDPANPFFVARGLKPGDAAVCHFLSRDSVLWAPAASTQGQGSVAAQ